MLVGLTALSVEISTIATAPAARAASATWRVPTALVSSPSSGFASTIGTCFSAAAWNTSSGSWSANTARSRPASRMSAMTTRRVTPGACSASSVSICHSAYSPLSSSTSSAGASVASCRASSEPMLPPAPVTSTRRPRTSRAIASRSSGTCGRFSRSSIATGRSSIRAASPARSAVSSAVGRGARRTGMPAASAVAINVASGGPAKSGSVSTSAEGVRSSRRSRSSTGPSSSSPPRIACPRSRRPVWRVPSEISPAIGSTAPRSWAAARRNRSAASPAPTSSTGDARASPRPRP